MKKWLKILLAADFFILLGAGMIAPIYAVFVEQIGGSIMDASIAWAIFSFTSGILLYLIGRWEDREKHYSKFLVAGYSLRAIGFLGYFFVSNTYHLFGVEILLGLSAAITLPSYDALYSNYLNKGHFAEEWGVWEGMNMMGAAAAALIGGGIASYFGFKTLFLIMFISGVIGAIVSTTLLSKKAMKVINKK